MPILFWICPDEREECFACDNEEQVYGEYLSEEMAVLDAIDLATMRAQPEARQRFGIAPNTSRLH